MEKTLFNAILSMDSYNRGYDPIIPLLGDQIGLATIIMDSSTLLDSNLNRYDIPTDFYALAYKMPNSPTWGGQTIISYRGTNSSLDALAYPIASGSTATTQGLLAFKFYNAVAETLNGNISIDPRLANIALTGHSLGGGLAGLVGAVYHKGASLFDNMPFEAAAYNSQFSPYPDYILNVYRGISPTWSPLVGPNSAMRTYSLDGEFLSWTRPAQQTPETTYSLPGNPNLAAWLPDVVSLHSMASLVIHMFSVTELNGSNDWQAASPHVWPTLYNDLFAQKIGAENAGTLRTKLAYSAIDEGTRVFGDTGIRAFYNDANDLGRVLTGPNVPTILTNVTNSFTTDMPKSIASSLGKVLVEFAGNLALNKVESTNFASAVNGVLTHSTALGNQTLKVDFSLPLWQQAYGGHGPVMAGRDDLVDQIFLSSGLLANEVRGQMGYLWGTTSPAAIEKVFLSTTNSTSTTISETASTGKAILTLGTGTNDTLNGSVTARNLVIAGNGDDTAVGGSKNDLIYGNAGNDTLSGNGGYDWLSGGSGDDTYVWNKTWAGQIVIQEFTGADRINLTSFSTANLQVIIRDGHYIAWAKDSSGPVGNLVFVNFDQTNDNTVFVNPDTTTKTLLQLLQESPGNGNTLPVDQGKPFIAPVGDPNGNEGNNVPDNFGYPGGSSTPSWLGPIAAGSLNGSRLGVGVSPLILDLDGDGVEVNNLKWGVAGSYTYFDMDNDGFAERTAWVTGGDGLLVRDLNGNGTIDGQNELFGNNVTFADGFAKLATLDTNVDNAITAGDAAFGSLKVWVDANMDGISQGSELKTLAELGITRINTNATELTNTYNNENIVSDRSTFVMNGVTRTIDDVWFRLDQTDTQYTGAVNINPETLFLPTLRGFGTLKDLHVAMSEDATLLTMVQNFANGWNTTKFFDFNGLNNDVQNILFRWAGVDGYAAGSVKYGMDAKIYDFVEKLTGYPYSATLSLTPDQSMSAPDTGSVSRMYNLAFAYMRSQLIFQTGGSALFDGDFRYDVTTGAIIGQGSINHNAIMALGAEANTNVNNSGMYWDSLNLFVLGIKPYHELSAADLSSLQQAYTGTPGDGSLWYQNRGSTAHFWFLAGGAQLTGDDMSNLIVGTQAADLLQAQGGDDEIYSGNGSDSTYGGAGNDVLYGEEGNDWMTGGTGNDLLVGGQHDDYLFGEAGNDTYIYHRGDGLDTIEDKGSGDFDVLRFGVGIALSDVTFTRDAAANKEYNVNILLNGASAIVLSYHTATWLSKVEQIQFADGTTLDLLQIRDVEGASGNDTLNGLDLSFMKDDYIKGQSGDDTLNGGLGNDILEGGSGSDRYIYSAGTGMGTDIVRDRGSWDTDTIQLGAGYTAANVSLVRSGDNDLNIVSGDKTLIKIEGQFDQNSVIERLTYGDGNTLDMLTQIYTRDGTSGDDNLVGTSYGSGGDILNGYSGNDSLSGGGGSDVLNGGDGNDSLSGDQGNNPANDGNDILRGGAGNDYIWAMGGNDTVIYDSGVDQLFGGNDGNDTIEIAIAGITAANMTLQRSGISDLNILINGQLSLQLFQQFSGGAYETIRFSNNTTFNLSMVQYTTNGTDNVDYLYGIGSGGNPNDVINGFGGNDYLAGLEGNDTLNGGSGDDQLVGGFGDDTYRIDLNTGLDTIQDDGGIDRIVLGAGYNLGSITVARDPQTSHELAVYSAGTKIAGITNYFHTNENYPYAGGTVIERIEDAGGGLLILSDLIFTATGTVGDDRLQGHSGRDQLIGLDGSDILYGYAGDDVLDGGADNDSLYGGSGNDSIIGGAGSDSIDGGDGNDILNGGDGNDYLYDYAGNDTFIYNGGADYVSEQINGDSDVLQVTTLASTGVYSWTDQNAFWIVSKTSSANSIQIASWRIGEGYMSTGQALGQVVFSDSVAWNLANGLTLNDNDTNHTLYGSLGADSMFGNGGNDNLYGYAGNDVLSGGIGGDYMDGGTGDDTFIYSEGIDYVVDSGGTDRIEFSAALNPMQAVITGNKIVFQAGVNEVNFSNINDIEFFKFNGLPDMTLAQLITWQTSNTDDTFTATAGADSFNGGGGLDTVTYVNATAGVTVDLLNNTHTGAFATGDTLTSIENVTGSGYGDFLYGDAGVNVLNGGANSDFLEGGAGADTLNGGSGNDTVRYTRSASGVTVNLLTNVNTGGDAQGDNLTSIENVVGSAYVDILTGANGNEQLNGGNGNDILYGGIGIDTLYGEGNNDTLYGGDGNDNLYGGSNDDIIYGDAGNDIVNGGDGDDVLFGGAGADAFTGGNGTDTVDYSSSTVAVTVNLSTNTASGGDATGDTFNTIEKIKGSAYNDTLTGSTGNDILEGAVGNDALDGGSGNDTYIYSAGLDTITDSAGVDIVQFAAGLLPSQVAVSGNTITFNAGTNVLTFANINTIETFRFSGYADMTLAQLIAAGAVNDTFTATASADSFNGAGGIDIVTYVNATAGVMVDLLNGTHTGIFAAGDALISIENVTGSAYADTLYGDSNANTLSSSGGNDFLEGGGGDDVLNGGSGNDTVQYTRSAVGVTVNLASNTGTGGDAQGDTFISIENVTGSAYADTITGGTIAETLKGQNGNDILNGGDGNDVLMGEGNDDILHGDAGNDTLYGGSGTDILYGDAGADIFRFSVSSMGTIDTIKDFSLAQADKLNIQDILVGWNATTKVITDYLELTTSGANTVMKVDRDGLGTAYTWSQTATIENVTGLTDEQALLTAGNIVA